MKEDTCPAWLLTTKQSGKEGAESAEGIGWGEYPHRWKTAEGPGIWAPEVDLKPWATGELQQVLEPD